MKTFRKFSEDELTEARKRKQSSYAPSDNEHCHRCGKETNYLMGDRECMRCYQSYAHDTPPEGPKKKKIQEETCPICKSGQIKPSGPFRECGNCKQIWNPALQPKKKLKEEEEEEEDVCHVCGTMVSTKTGDGLTYCGDCGKPTCYDHRNIDDPGDRCTKCKPKKKARKVSEDEGGSTGGPMPTNAAGQAGIAGIGIQRKGEPSFAEPGVSVRRKLEIVGPDPVDPRIFADKIFGHSKLSDAVTEWVVGDKVQHAETPHICGKITRISSDGHAIVTASKKQSFKIPLTSLAKKTKAKPTQKLANFGDKTSAMPDSNGKYHKVK